MKFASLIGFWIRIFASCDWDLDSFRCDDYVVVGTRHDDGRVKRAGAGQKIRKCIFEK